LAGLSLRAALALECGSATTSTLTACDEHPLTGRTGPTLRLGSLVAYASIGRYARSPTLGERYGTSSFVRGDPRLKPEIGETLDLGARFHERQWFGLWLSAAGFARRAERLIVFTRTAQGYVVPENRESARVLGLELGVGASPLSGLDFDAGVALTDARDTSPTRRTVNDVLPFQPRLAFSSGLSFARELDLGPFDSVLVGARYVHQASRYADAAGKEVMPEQGALEVVGESELLRRALVVRLRLDNAFDQRRFDVVGFPLPGTSMYASLEARL
jgi:iron complex outermembrane receptor protein